MDIKKFIKTIRNEDVTEIIVKTKDCIYRWTEDKTFIAPIKKTHSQDLRIITYEDGTAEDKNY
jgi:hypothetical protein